MPRPFGDLSGDAALVRVISPMDYPASAVMNLWQGTVRTRLSINSQGRVSSCNIVQTSGYAVLDASTCRLLTARARFIPATDQYGKPVEGVYDAPPIRWKLVR